MAKDDKESSIFKSALITAPIAIGAGMSISALMKDRTLAAQRIQEPTIRSAQQGIRNLVSGYADLPHGENRNIAKLWNIENVMLPPEHIKSMFLNTVRVTDPSGQLANAFMARFEQSKTGGEVLGDIINILGSSQSIYTKRAASLFAADMSVFNTRMESNLPINPISFKGNITKTPEQLLLGEVEPTIRADIIRTQKMLGAEVNIRRISRQGVEGSELHLQFSGSKFFGGKISLRIPEEIEGKPGMIARGMTQQSKYIAGRYGLVEQGILKESFNHQQWTMRRAYEELVPKLMTQERLSQRAAQYLTHNFESKLMEPPEWIPTFAAGVHQGVEEYEWIRSNILRLHTPGEQAGSVRVLTEMEQADIVGRGGLTLAGGGTLPVFPGHSPTLIAHGAMSTMDTRSLMYLMPEAAPYGRRPLQFLRPDFIPTPSSLEAITKDPYNIKMSWAKSLAGVEAPMIHAGFVSAANKAMWDTGMTTEGQFLISQAVANQRKMQKWVQYDVASDQLLDLEKFIDIESPTGVWDINKVTEEEMLLGRDPFGRPVTIPAGTTLVQATAEQDKAKKDFIKVMGLQNIEDIEYAKYFGIKEMAKEVPRSYLTELMNKNMGIYGQSIEALITMDELKKNRGLHYNQMFTSLWEYARANMRSGLTSSTVASNFVNDPLDTISRIHRQVVKNDLIDNNKMLYKLMNIARASKLSASQMGRVFGAVPEVFGLENLEDDWMKTIMLGKGISKKQLARSMNVAKYGLSAMEAAEIGKGFATGSLQLFYGGPGGPGAGKTASIEPRLFELLGSPHFGELGPTLQTDISRRMLSAYPERMIEQEELTKSFMSIAKPSVSKTSVDALTLINNITTGELLPTEASYLKVKGIGDIYIPGQGQISQMASWMTPAGDIYNMPLVHRYRDVIEGAQEFQGNKITEEAMRQKLNNLQNALGDARISTIMGKGGLLRTQLPGSVFLTGVQATPEMKLPKGVWGITDPYAKQMFSEMKELGLYQEADLAKMQTEFYEGKQIYGWAGRHPFLGPYSTQPIAMQRIPGRGAIAAIREDLRPINIMPGTIQSAQDRIDLITGQGKAMMLENPVNLSPLVGHAGDVDADLYSMSLAGPQLQHPLKRHVESALNIEAYQQYAIRSQLLKAKAKGGEITLNQAMAGDIIKLAQTGGQGRLGAVSVELQSYKAAVLSGAGGLSAAESMQGLGLLEWLEQTPISAKHITPGEEKKLVLSMDQLQRSLSRKSAPAIVDVTRNVLSIADKAGQLALDKGFTAAIKDQGSVRIMSIPGIEIEQTAANLVRAQNAFQQTEVGGMMASRLRQVIRGQGHKATGQEYQKLMDPRVLEMSPFGAFFTGKEVGTAARIADQSLSFINQLGASGKSMLKYAKPLAIGTGIGLGIATLLSEPPRVLPEGANIPNASPHKAGTGGANIGTNIHPASNISGRPTARPQIQHSASISQSSDAYRVDINGSTRQPINSYDVSDQLRSSMNRKTRVHSTTRDLRSSLTPHRISSILDEGS